MNQPVPQDVAQAVRERAHDRCEYCHLPASVYPLPFHVDHIVARQHGGQNVLENLALACLHCNRHKGPNIAGVDPVTKKLTGSSTLGDTSGNATSAGTGPCSWAGRPSDG